jgi:hypothetical protein
MAYEVFVNLTALRRHPGLDLYRIMSGDGQPYFDPRSYLLVGSLPWATMGVVLALSAAVLLAAHLQTRRRDF